MSVKTNKLIAFASTALLSIVGVGAISTPAHAAACPYPVENQASNDKPKYNIRLISPLLTDDNSIRRYDFESQFTVDCDWFGVGMRFNQVYVPFGLRTNLVFQATTPTGAPVANATVTLRANKGYSNSNAAVKVNGIKARPAPSNASDGANIVGKTDANGVVNFVVASPDDCEAYGGILPDAPANPGADTPNDTNADPTTDCFSQFLPSITGEKTDSADFVELHYFNPAGLDFNYQGVDADMTWLAPTLRTADVGNLKANAIETAFSLQTYAPIGSKQVIAVQAKKADGSYIRNRPISISVNFAPEYGSVAKVSAGVFSLTGATSPRAADSSKKTGTQLTLSGTTDSFGVAVFTLNSLATTGLVPPKSLTPPAAGAIFANVSTSFTDGFSRGLALEVFYYKPIPPTSIAAAAAGRKITVTLSYAKGKKSSISITGLKAASVTPTVDKKAYTYVVKAGKITVKVVSNGKTLTKVFTVK